MRLRKPLLYPVSCGARAQRSPGRRQYWCESRAHRGPIHIPARPHRSALSRDNEFWGRDYADLSIVIAVTGIHCLCRRRHSSFRRRIALDPIEHNLKVAARGPY
jgi:hypothetical protein